MQYQYTPSDEMVMVAAVAVDVGVVAGVVVVVVSAVVEVLVLAVDVLTVSVAVLAVVGAETVETAVTSASHIHQQQSINQPPTSS